MTHDQLAKIAYRVTEDGIPIYAFTLNELAEFAEAVAAEEREACAKVCEEMKAPWMEWPYDGACVDCANAIRTRGDA